MRRFVLAALAAAMLPLAPAQAEPAKRAVAVCDEPGQPIGAALRQALGNLGRYRMLPVAGGPIAPQTFLAEVADAARAAGIQQDSFALVPRLSFGAVSTDEPSTSTDQYGESTVSADLTCPYTLHVDVYDANTRQLVTSLVETTDLTRKFEYNYDRHTDRQAIVQKGEELAEAMSEAAALPPAVGFASQASDGESVLVYLLVGALTRLPAFQLRGAVTGWSAPSDRIAIDLGTDFKVKVDDGFQIRRDGRAIGYVKVRRLSAAGSETQPIFMDDALRVGDQVVEYPKLNSFQGFKAGVAWLGRPAFVGTYSGEVDFGGWTSLSELYGAWDFSLLNTGAVSGGMGELGLVKRFVFRRWSFKLGLKGGFASLNGLTGTATVPGGAIASGVDCYLTPDWLWSTDLAYEAYLPVRQKGGAANGQLINPLGPLVRTGISYVF
ncbi:MAG TPA: hypothetical protein V6D47_14135 [Oscillatoriaceae cyanobacterium]